MLKMKKNGSFMLFTVAVLLVYGFSLLYFFSPPSTSTPTLTTKQFFTQIISSIKPPLELDFYRDSCPRAEMIIRSTVDEAFANQSSVGPQLVRLLFHDCFIMGCDGSVLLNSTDGGQTETEKDQVPNQTLKGFDVIEEIKSRVESACPGVVSCSDILVLAARESVFLSGGPLYPLQTGRRDRNTSFPDMAFKDLPAPTDDLSTILSKFSDRQFTVQETVSLLGAHSVGRVHCNFIQNRLQNLSATGQPDLTIERTFMNIMRNRCRNPAAFIDLKKDGAQEEGFGTHYFQGLVQNKSVLRSDQELMSTERTASWVRAYASSQLVFTDDFSRAMTKLSNTGVLTGLDGEIREKCSTSL